MCAPTATTFRALRDHAVTHCHAHTQRIQLRPRGAAPTAQAHRLRCPRRARPSAMPGNRCRRGRSTWTARCLMWLQARAPSALRLPPRACLPSAAFCSGRGRCTRGARASCWTMAFCRTPRGLRCGESGDRRRAQVIRGFIVRTCILSGPAFPQPGPELKRFENTPQAPSTTVAAQWPRHGHAGLANILR